MVTAVFQSLPSLDSYSYHSFTKIWKKKNGKEENSVVL